jgi:periplasmic copper chaperone A
MAASLLAACDLAPSTICVTAAAPSIRLPAVPGRPGAGYFDIQARPGQGGLLSVSSPRIARIEIHETATRNGVASMRRIKRIAADDCNRFTTAGGRHLMLFGLDPSLRPGDDVPLTFHFEHGAPQTVAAGVFAAGDEPAR